MGDFKRGGGKRFNGPGERYARANNARGGFGGGNRESRGPVTMYQAICSKCGKSCEVPFRPSGDKPVYCNDCFVRKDGGDRNNDRGRDRFPEKNRGNFKPAFKPEYKNNVGGGGNDALKRQIENLNVKMDKLITLMEGARTTKPTETIKKIRLASKKVPLAKTKKSAKKSVKK